MRKIPCKDANICSAARAFLSLVRGTSNISKVAAGQLFFAAIDQSGSVYTGGLNVDQALGRSSSEINASPATLPDIPAMQDIAVGDNFMLALTKDSRIYGWGSNSAGQLGLGHLNTVNTPEPINISAKINSITIGSTHVLAVSTEGKVYGWGSNHFGQSGNTSHLYLDSPQLISLPEKIIAVAAGMHLMPIMRWTYLQRLTRKKPALILLRLALLKPYFRKRIVDAHF